MQLCFLPRRGLLARRVLLLLRKNDDDDAMLKITSRPNGGGARRVLKLEGRLGGAWIDEVRSLSDRILGDGGVLTLDLAGVSYVERAGAALLAQLAQRAVRVVGCSAFVAEQLRAEE